MMKKIRILRIIARLNIGGPAIQAVSLTRALNDEDFESVLLSGLVEKNEEQMDFLINKHKLNLIFISELGRKINIFKDIPALWKVYKFMKRYKPDIVHTHTSKGGFIGRFAAFLLKAPIIVHTFHGHTFYGYFGLMKGRIFLAIERALSKITDRVIAISPLQLDDIVENFKVAGHSRCMIIPLGFELGDFLKIGPAGNNDDFIIGTVGRMTAVKDHKLFLDIADSFYRSHKDGRVKFVIVGDGELRGKLIDYRDSLGLREKVQFFGWQKDMPRFYSGFDMFLLTSKNEGTPVSAIEAMASARPVISTGVGGVPDLIKDGETGFLVRERDPKEFVVKIEKLLYNKEARASMGEKARESVKDFYSKDRLVKDIRGLYLKLLEEKGAL